MKTLLVRQRISYTGEQLRSRWAFRSFGLAGESMVCFRGDCQVGEERLVDLADQREGKFIRSEDMLHFIVEHLELDLEKTTLRQRMLVCLAAEELNRRLKEQQVKRMGDDLFVGERKLSVSIATLSPVSSMIHLGLNISSRNTPVPAIGLSDLGVAPEEFAISLMESYQREVGQVRQAGWKVRGVE